MATISPTRPIDPDDYPMWQSYHEAQAARIAKEPPPADLMARVGQLQGEMDHRAEALTYQRMQEQRNYDVAMAGLREDAYDWQKTHLAGYEPQKTLAGLQTVHRHEQALMWERAAVAASRMSEAGLSSDDVMLAYRQGANNALTESYWEQKRAHGFGNSNPKELEYGRMAREHNESFYVGRPEDYKRAALEAGKILHLDEQTPVRRAQLEHMLDTTRAYLKDSGVEPVKAWTVAATEIVRHQSYEAGQRFIAGESRPLPADWPAHSLSLEDFSRGIADYRKEHGVPEIVKDIERKEFDPAAVAKAIVDEHIGSRAAEIDREWRAIEAPTAIAAGAATNYFRGRAEEWNSLREVLVEKHPDLVKDLPAAIQVDEIQVRQRVLEQEQSQGNRLALAR